MDKIKFVKFREDAIIPTRELHNAGYDIYANFEEESVLIEPHTTKLVPTGIGSIIPEGYYIQIYERGSTGSLGIKHSAGVIDSSFRGEWFLAITNSTNKNILINKNVETVHITEDTIHYPYSKALFQGVLHSTHNEILSEEISMEEFQKDKTDRGDGKLGSTNK